MKKKLLVFWMTLICSALLSGCFCEHQWQDATCMEPRTCAECGKTEGEPTVHKFQPADCIHPRTCEYCGLAEGKTAEHIWKEADCTTPKTCTVCGTTEGEPAPHSWQDATTDAPKTCDVCGATEGEPIKTDPRFTSSAAAPLLGKWGLEVTATGEMMGLEGFPGEVSYALTIEFGPDGTFTYGIELRDEESFKESMVKYTLEQTYAKFAEEGLEREDADGTIWDNYGMTTEQYIRKLVAEMNFTELLSAVSSALNIGGVYYVEAPFVYNAQTWEEEMDITMFGFDEYGALYISDYCMQLGADARFEKITEEAAAEETVTGETEETEESVPETIPEETEAAVTAETAAEEAITA